LNILILVAFGWHLTVAFAKIPNIYSNLPIQINRNKQDRKIEEALSTLIIKKNIILFDC